MKKLALAATVLAVLAGLTACQKDVTMWSPCQPAADGNPTGTDGTYVLACRNGTWEPIMTVVEWLAISSGKRVTIAPLPERPTPPAAPAPTSTTTTSTTVADPWAAPQCWDTTDEGGYDLALVGARNTLGNARYAASSDGSCTGDLGALTVLQAIDETAALEVCNTLLSVGAYFVLQVNQSWSTAPADGWLCVEYDPGG